MQRRRDGPEKRKGTLKMQNQAPSSLVQRIVTYQHRIQRTDVVDASRNNSNCPFHRKGAGKRTIRVRHFIRQRPSLTSRTQDQESMRRPRRDLYDGLCVR